MNASQPLSALSGGSSPRIVKLLVGFVLGVVQLIACAQGVLLKEGKSYVFEFTSLPYIRPAQNDFNSFSVTFAQGTFSDGETALVELFTNSLTDLPLSSTFSGSGGPLDQVVAVYGWRSGSPPFWPNLHGLARVTMIIGDAEITDFAVRQIVAGGVYFQTFPVSTPKLRLGPSALGNGQLQITWPTNSTGYSLEYATNIGAPFWSTVTNSVTNSVGIFSVTIDTGSGSRFFRLYKP